MTGEEEMENRRLRPAAEASDGCRELVTDNGQLQSVQSQLDVRLSVYARVYDLGS